MSAWWVVFLIVAVVVAGTVIVLRHRTLAAAGPIERPTRDERLDAQVAVLKAFAPLGIGEKLAIRFRVRRGLPVTRSELAPAATLHARMARIHERTRLSRIQWLPLLPFTGLAVISFVNWLNRDRPSNAPGVLDELWPGIMFALWLIVVVLIVTPGRSLLRRFDRAVAANEQLVAGRQSSD